MQLLFEYHSSAMDFSSEKSDVLSWLESRSPNAVRDGRRAIVLYFCSETKEIDQTDAQKCFIQLSNGNGRVRTGVLAHRPKEPS